MGSRTKLKTCERKTRFLSETSAATFALRRQVKQWPYRCNRCDRWHLTSRAPKDQSQ
jgi:hypothetical protein